MEYVYKFFGGSKMFMALVVLGLGSAGAWFGKLSEAGWITMALAALTIYGAGNALDKFIPRPGGPNGPKDAN
jgi:hypothetical protein